MKVASCLIQWIDLLPMKYYPILMLLVLIRPVVKGQDLYSFDATSQFANYLFTKGEYAFASEEYARLFFMQSHNDSLLLRLSQSYRKQGKYEVANDLFQKYRPASLSNGWIEQEYIATLLFQKDEKKFEEGLSVLRYTSDDALLRNRVEFALLTRDWSKAASYLQSSDLPYSWRESYRHTLESAQAFKAKKPWLAATYSAIIPGSGKFYAKNPKEGITSFFFVTALGYQSYRAFKRRGTNTVTGWIYGGLSLGFYLGNIYGAHQSARNYNSRRLDAIYHEVDQIIYSRY